MSRTDRCMLLSRVRRTIEDRRLLTRGQRVLLAVSGGPDSVAMMDVIARLRTSMALGVAVASIDHGLRSEGADELAQVCRLAQERRLPFFSARLELAKDGGSLQERARRARYQALHEIAVTFGADALCTAHTRDDQAETVLMRLMRGSGVRGLCGIEPRRADGVVRPLIDATRQDVLDWLLEHRVPFVSDPSNVDVRYERTRVRHQVLPCLREEESEVSAHLAQLADDAADLMELARREADRHWADCFDSERLGLSIPATVALPRAVRIEVESRWISDLTGERPKRAHLDAMEKVLQGKGEALLPKGWVARSSDRRWVVGTREEA